MNNRRRAADVNIPAIRNRLFHTQPGNTHRLLSWTIDLQHKRVSTGKYSHGFAKINQRARQLWSGTGRKFEPCDSETAPIPMKRMPANAMTCSQQVYESGEWRQSHYTDAQITRLHLCLFNRWECSPGSQGSGSVWQIEAHTWNNRLISWRVKEDFDGETCCLESSSRQQNWKWQGK